MAVSGFVSSSLSPALMETGGSLISATDRGWGLFAVPALPRAFFSSLTTPMADNAERLASMLSSRVEATPARPVQAATRPCDRLAIVRNINNFSDPWSSRQSLSQEARDIARSPIRGRWIVVQKHAVKGPGQDLALPNDVFVAPRVHLLSRQRFASGGGTGPAQTRPRPALRCCGSRR